MFDYVCGYFSNHNYSNNVKRSRYQNPKICIEIIPWFCQMVCICVVITSAGVVSYLALLFSLLSFIQHRSTIFYINKTSLLFLIELSKL